MSMLVVLHSTIVQLPLLPLPREANRIIYERLLRNIDSSLSDSGLSRLSPETPTIRFPHQRQQFLQEFDSLIQ